MGWVILGCVLGVLVVDLGIRLLAIRFILPFFERKPPLAAPHSQPDEEAARIQITRNDGGTLHGCLYQHMRPSRGLIVFCPEMGGDRWTAMQYCRGLWQAGFDILAFDFSGQGESDPREGYDPLHWVSRYELDDVLSVIAHCKQDPHLRDAPLSLFGMSRGGCSALAAAAVSEDVVSVVAEGAYMTDAMMEHYALQWSGMIVPKWVMRLFPMWHVRGTLALARRISQRRRHCEFLVLEKSLRKLRDKDVLLINGAADHYVPQTVAQLMHRTLNGRRQELWIVPEANHNLARQNSPEEYDCRLESFFSAAMPQPTFDDADAKKVEQRSSVVRQG